MKAALLILLLNSFISFGQDNKFKFTDTIFRPGQEIDIEIRFYPDMGMGMVIDSTTITSLDSIKDFVLSHSDFVFEVQCNTDYRGDSSFNLKLTEQRCKNVIRWLESEGVDPNHLKSNPQGERLPATLTSCEYLYSLLPKELQTGESYLLTEAFLIKFKADRRLFESLNQQNRRTVFRVVSI